MIARFLALLAIALLATGAVDPNDPFKAASIEERRGAAIPLDLPFVASTGQAVTLRRLAGGKPLLIAPVQHECPNICGVTLAGIADAIDGQAKYTPGGTSPSSRSASTRAKGLRRRKRISSASLRNVRMAPGSRLRSPAATKPCTRSPMPLATVTPGRTN